MSLRDKAAQLPLLPGVYLYKDEHGTVIYVGKAKNLRSRVRSYFNDERLADSKTGTLISEATDVEYILVDNEKEALALENNLIKQWKPRFNILLRDDKTYPYIKLTNEKYPRLFRKRMDCLPFSNVARIASLSFLLKTPKLRCFISSRMSTTVTGGRGLPSILLVSLRRL